MNPQNAPYYITLIVAVLIPTLAAMLGILFSNQNLARIEARMDARFTAMDARFTAMDARFNAMETKMDHLAESVHADIKQLVQLHHDTDVRITRLEERNR